MDPNGMNSMPESMFPIGFNNMYQNMFSFMSPFMNFNNNNVGMNYPLMYPDIYYKIYPYACKVCDKMDNPYVAYPSESNVQSMIDECYDQCVREVSDLEEYFGQKVSADDKGETKIRRRRLLRDLIGIILISELFRRRRRPGRSPYGYYGY